MAKSSDKTGPKAPPSKRMAGEPKGKPAHQPADVNRLQEKGAERRRHRRVAADFPLELLPPEPGVLVADAYDAAEIRPLQPFTLAATRRRVLQLRFARLAALRSLGVEAAEPFA